MPATNSLIITAPEPLYRNMRQIIDKLDVRRAQVVIESLIAEVSAEKAAEFGIQWQALGGINDPGTNVVGGTNFGGTGQNIIGVAQNIGCAGQGLNIGIVQGQGQHSRRRRDSQPRLPGARAGDQGGRQHPVDPDHPDAGQRRGQVPRRPEHPADHRFVRQHGRAAVPPAE